MFVLVDRVPIRLCLSAVKPIRKEAGHWVTIPALVGAPRLVLDACGESSMSKPSSQSVLA